MKQNDDSGHSTATTPDIRETQTGDTNNTKKQQKITKNQKQGQEEPYCTDHNCYDCAVNNIVNLSNIQLTKAQVLLLNRSLSFVPTANDAKPTELIRHFDIFTVKAKRKLHQMVNPPRPSRPNDEPPLFRKPTNTQNTNITPLTLGPRALEDTFETIRVEISQIEHNTTTTRNLTRKERLALKELTSNQDIIINKADKGSTIVVRHRQDYTEAGLQYLSDVNTYLELDRDYTTDVTKAVKTTLQKLTVQGLISPRMAKYCLPPPTSHPENSTHILSKKDIQNTNGHQTDSVHP